MHIYKKSNPPIVCGCCSSVVSWASVLSPLLLQAQRKHPFSSWRLLVSSIVPGIPVTHLPSRAACVSPPPTCSDADCHTEARAAEWVRSFIHNLGASRRRLCCPPAARVWQRDGGSKEIKKKKCIYINIYVTSSTKRHRQGPAFSGPTQKSHDSLSAYGTDGRSSTAGLRAKCFINLECCRKFTCFMFCFWY